MFPRKSHYKARKTPDHSQDLKETRKRIKEIVENNDTTKRNRKYN